MKNKYHVVISTATIGISLMAVQVASAAESAITTHNIADCKTCGEPKSENGVGARTVVKKDFTVTEEKNLQDVSGGGTGGVVREPDSGAVTSPQTEPAAQ